MIDSNLPATAGVRVEDKDKGGQRVDQGREREGEGRAERERMEKERAEKERMERGRVEKERAERERTDKERAEKEWERAEKERELVEKERAERDRVEKERTERKRMDKERAERERAEKEREQRERMEEHPKKKRTGLEIGAEDGHELRPVQTIDKERPGLKVSFCSHLTRTTLTHSTTAPNEPKVPRTRETKGRWGVRKENDGPSRRDTESGAPFRKHNDREFSGRCHPDLASHLITP